VAPELIIALVMLTAVTLYALLAGADFGAGIWEFNTALQASQKERRLIYRAIGPVWETNHIWLIFILVLMFSAFPTVLAGLSRALWIPLLLGLAGIVFRGGSYVFQYAAVGDMRQRQLWNVVFAAASTAAPFFLGACVGAIASGTLAIAPDGKFTGSYLTGWLTPMTIFAAFFAVGICSYLSAVYLVREARCQHDRELTSLWRRRALSSGVWMGILAAVGLVLVYLESKSLWAGFTQHAWPAVIASAVGGLVSLAALWLRQYLVATLGAGLAVTAVIAGWGWAQYPVMLFTPGETPITIEAVKGPDSVLWMMIYGAAAGAVLVVPSLVWLFYLFKANPTNSTNSD